MVTPNSNITLLKTPMELSDANTLSFATETAKYNYFNSLTKLELTGATYQRKEGVVRYPTTSGITFEDILEYNYCMYQNASYDTKWFYAYITDVRYINDGMVEISLKTDAFMTWQNDITYKASFIEREHVADDTIGLHTVPENLATGEYIEKPLTSTEYIEWTGLIGTCQVVLGVTEEPHGYAYPQNYYSIFGGNYSALTYITFRTSDDCEKYIRDIQGLTNGDVIVTAFMVPQKMLGSVDYFTPSDKNFEMGYINGYNGTKNLNTLHLSKPSSIDGYVPKNNKVYCYPYTYLMLSNNTGENNIYHYEYFNSNDVVFSIDGTLSVGCSIKAFPVDYNYSSSLSYTDTHTIQSTNMAKLPTCSWKNDAYTNWLTQNGVNVFVGTATGAGAVALGTALLFSGVGATAGLASIGGGLMSIYNSLKADYQAKLIPDSANGGMNQGDVVFALGHLLIPTQFTIRNEYAKIIDDYFTMYGYKVNALEVINPHKRTYFDYIKTIGCNIIGNIPQADMEEIRKLFDNGLTIWHNTSHFLDYSVNNAIIS